MRDAVILAPLVALCAATGVSGSDGFDAWHDRARYEIAYRARLSELPPAVLAGARLWIPLPREGFLQHVSGLTIDAAQTSRQTGDSAGNRFLYVELPENGAEAGDVVVRCTVERAPASAYRGDPPWGNPERYLGGQRRVPLTGRLRALAAKVTLHSETPGERIRALYDYVFTTMRYAKEGTGWGQGDAGWACESKYGNCTDFHSVFMGMARSQRVPTRFLIGFPIPADKVEGEVKGYHCWAEAYDAARGWTPVDISEAWKARKRNAFFGKLPSDRISMTVGRDLILDPPQKGAPINFLVYPYLETSEGEPQNVPWTFRYRRIRPLEVEGGVAPVSNR